MEISNRLKTKEQQIKTERENAQLMQELLENEAQREVIFTTKQPGFGI